MPEFTHGFGVGDFVHFWKISIPGGVYGTIIHVAPGFIGILGTDGEYYKTPDLNSLKHTTKEEFKAAEVVDA